ncbi:hypothetical protein ACH4SP_23150 [Streptomyces sp. NPDC021093]|uniref:hypothetical protein n=1 Tax=Streptomyces sp. NPDC021093 TaxID=3365112 RepID=UPI0037A3B59E
MLWRRAGSVLTGCGAGSLVLLAVWLWPGQDAAPSMGSAVIVPAPHRPTPSVTEGTATRGPKPSVTPSYGPRPSVTVTLGPGRPAAAPPAPSPLPPRTSSGGRAVQAPPPPGADIEETFLVPGGDADDEWDEETDEEWDD